MPAKGESPATLHERPGPIRHDRRLIVAARASPNCLSGQLAEQCSARDGESSPAPAYTIACQRAG